MVLELTPGFEHLIPNRVAVEDQDNDMTIPHTPGQEQVIGRAIQAGVIRAADDVVIVGVETIQRRLEERRAFVNLPSAEQWLKEFHAWVHSHPTTTPLLSDEAIDRESIYGARGQCAASPRFCREEPAVRNTLIAARER